MSTKQSEHRDPWDRLPNERSKAWLCFQKYLAMPPPRSLINAKDVIERSFSQTRAYSAKYNWIARATAWDEAQARAEKQAILSEWQRIGREHFKAGNLLRSLGLNSLAAHSRQQAKAQRKDEDATLFNHRDSVNMLREGVEMERTLIQEALDREVIAAGGGEYDTSVLSDDELTQFLALLRKMEASGDE